MVIKIVKILFGIAVKPTYVDFYYTTSDPDGIRIWIQPYSEGNNTPGGGFASSPLYPQYGQFGTQYFLVVEGSDEVLVDQYHVTMSDADETEHYLEFNRMAQQIRDLIQQLEESNTARRRLIAHATHEMKSPITSINGFVDIIAGDEDGRISLVRNSGRAVSVSSTVLPNKAWKIAMRRQASCTFSSESVVIPIAGM